MPHSVSPTADAEGASSPPSTAQMQDAPADVAPSSPQVEDDIPMAGVEGVKEDVDKPEQTTEAPVAQKETDEEMPDIEMEKKPEIKLEDLFDGVDSDDDDLFDLQGPPPVPEYALPCSPIQVHTH